MVEKSDKERLDNVSDEDEKEDDESLMCRFYRNEFPEENELVVVKIRNVHDTGAYVSLLEYNEIEGMIPFTEVTKKRVNTVSRLVKVGKTEIMMVLRVDPVKGYIDLSRKKVHMEEAQVRDQHYKKAKVVHSILKHTASKLQVPLKDLYEKFGWDCYDRFGHAYEGFKVAMNDQEAFFKDINVSEEEREALLENIGKRLMPSAIKIRTEFELTCFAYEGIETIKKALLAAKAAVVEENYDIKFKLIAPPIYNAEILTLDKPKSVQKLERALQIIEKEVIEGDGKFKLVYGPKIIGAGDDKDMDDLIGIMKDDKEDGSETGQEDNDEGMGDIEIEGMEDDTQEQEEVDN